MLILNGVAWGACVFLKFLFGECLIEFFFQVDNSDIRKRGRNSPPTHGYTPNQTLTYTQKQIYTPTQIHRYKHTHTYAPTPTPHIQHTHNTHTLTHTYTTDTRTHPQHTLPHTEVNEWYKIQIDYALSAGFNQQVFLCCKNHTPCKWVPVSSLLSLFLTLYCDFITLIITIIIILIVSIILNLISLYWCHYSYPNSFILNVTLFSFYLPLSIYLITIIIF